MDKAPQNWERANIAHSFKGEGRGKEAKNYRPVSLVSAPEKMLKQNKSSLRQSEEKKKPKVLIN